MSERKGGSWAKALYRGFLDGLAAPTLLVETPQGSRKYAERDSRPFRISAIADQAFRGVYNEFGPRGGAGGVVAVRQGESFRKAGK